jgi:hypothetical protein
MMAAKLAKAEKERELVWNHNEGLRKEVSTLANKVSSLTGMLRKAQGK